MTHQSNAGDTASAPKVKVPNDIHIEVSVTVPIRETDKRRFENAAIEFLFGYDRLRPELENAVSARGVNINRLASLCVPETLGVCSVPGALEFIPGPELIQFARARGVDLTSSGTVSVSFRYDTADESVPARNAIGIKLGLPEALTGGEEISTEVVGEIAQALFGDCELTARAQAYLHAFGVDIVEIAEQHRTLLRGGEVPPTTRVRPAIAELLNGLGFRTDVLGQMQVETILDVSAVQPLRPVWERATCC